MSARVDAAQISIIVPTLNEAANLEALVGRIDRALIGRPYEILIVDDQSQDDTPVVAQRLAEHYPVRLIVRERVADGLSGAVLRGFAEARGKYLLVMDADLQHPPEKLPELLEPLETQQADFVLGSRYAPGGSTAGRWGLLRRINSRAATLLARPFSGRVSDPMSGFFALERSTFERAQRLTPLGYKIALELMCKARVRRVREVPIHFAQRTRGQSKLTLREQFRYLEHLSRLYDFTFPRASPVVKFAIVLTVSWVVGLAIFAALRVAGAGAVAAVVIGYIAALAITALFHLRYVRTQREFLIRPNPWLDYAFIAIAELGTCAAAALWVSARVAAATPAEHFVIPFAVATVVRYILRKELLQDIRGLRKEFRAEELS